jgi:hypothetical protein
MTLSSPCPVELDTREILDHGQSMRSSMQKLRRDLENCPHCPRFMSSQCLELAETTPKLTSAKLADCPILQNLNAQVSAAVQDITDEWNLASTIC